MKSLVNPWTVLILLLGTVVLPACDAPSPTDPASTARIYLTAGALRLPADGVSQTTVMAYVRNPDGTNADAVAINWYTTCGILTEGAGAVSGGTSTVSIVTEAFPCTATITADLPTMSLRDTISIEFYDEDAAYITVTANPTDIPADGESTCVLTAYVQDEFGHPVPEDTTVIFSSDAGTIGTTTVGTEQGRAVTTMTSSNVEATAKVTAVCGSRSAQTNVRFYSTLVGWIELRASQYEIPADGSSKTVITATVKDVNGRLVKDGTHIYFTATAGTLSDSSATTYQGIATIFLTSSTEVTTSVVSATGGNKTSVIYIRFTDDGSTLSIDPPYAVVPVLGTRAFIARGGTSPYNWYLNDNTYGSLQTSGNQAIFTASQKTGSVHLYVVDSRGSSASALIVIGEDN